MDEEHKKKIAKALKGNSNSKGKKWTEERRKRFHESTVNHAVSKETRQKLSRFFKGRPAPKHLGNKYAKGYVPTEEHRRKIAEGRMGEKHWNWKGGNPHCTVCDKVLSSRIAKTCRLHVPRRLGDQHPQWKGDNVGYPGIHAWVSKTLGKPDTCEFCHKSGLSGRNINWANKSGLYKRDISDWIRLCVSCHTIYDKRERTYPQ